MTAPYRSPAEEAKGRLAAKPVGDYYSVALRDKDFSLLKVGIAGGLGGSGGFPLPDFGDRCACCNGEADRTLAFDPSTDRMHVDPINVPVCGTCQGHMKRNTSAAQILGGVLIPMALGGAIWSAASELYAVTALSVVVGIAITLYILRGRAKRRETARNGHHPELEMGATIGQISVRTTNKRLAERILDAHVKTLQTR